MAPGYAWSFPLAGGTANVGYGVLRRPGAGLGPLRGQRIDLLSRPHIAAVLGPDASPIGPWKSWPIPSRIGATALAGLGGRVLFAGDAARACDPMTGEGIAQALETAELAARLISWAGPSRPEEAANRYRRQIRWGMAVDDRLARDLSKVLAHPEGPRERCGSPTAAPGCGGTSPAGCSRTIRELSSSPRTAGTGTSSPAREPSPLRMGQRTAHSPRPKVGTPLGGPTTLDCHGRSRLRREGGDRDRRRRGPRASSTPCCWRPGAHAWSSTTSAARSTATVPMPPWPRRWPQEIRDSAAKRSPTPTACRRLREARRSCRPRSTPSTDRHRRQQRRHPARQDLPQHDARPARARSSTCT